MKSIKIDRNNEGKEEKTEKKEREYTREKTMTEEKADAMSL
jgi:hypothetical protein